MVSNGMEEVYVNAAVDDKSDVAKLMKVFTEDNTYNDVKFPITSEIKRRFKTTEEGVSEMCEVIERNRAEAAASAAIELLVSLVKKGKLTIEEAAEESGLSLSDFTKKLSMA